MMSSEHWHINIESPTTFAESYLSSNQRGCAHKRKHVWRMYALKDLAALVKLREFELNKVETMLQHFPMEEEIVHES